jgi:hypothetical protein
MRKSLLVVCSLALLLSFTEAAQAQDTKTTSATQTTAVQNADGSWTVVAYPTDREVEVELTPVAATAGAAPRVKVRHMTDGTEITVDPANFVGSNQKLNLYVVDPEGKTTLLGPITTTSSIPVTFKTDLDKFMLVVSPESNLTQYSPNTSATYRSAVPAGLAVIPVVRKGLGPNAPRGEKVASVAAPYNSVPMLGIPTLPVKKETELKVNFTDPTIAPRANFFITPNFNNQGRTRVKAKFHELSMVPTDMYLTLWAVSPDGQFWRIGSARNKGNPNVATIDSDKNNTNVPFTDFGLFMTIEPTDTATSPTSTIYGTVGK